MTRRILLALAGVCSVAAAAVWATGGIATSIAGIRLSARSPTAAAVAAIALAAAWALAAGRAGALAADLARVDAWCARRANRVVLAIAALAGALAVRFQTFSAAGADASGYLSQAAMLASARLTHTEPFAALANWPDPGPTLVPLGWLATADPATQVPTYAIGLPLLMTPLHAAGGALLASLLGPLSLALAVWMSARLAREIAGPFPAMLTAAWVATSPAALWAAMQPLSDLPAAAAWLACWVAVFAAIAATPRRTATRALLAGAAAALAVLIRPNLAPLAAVPFLLLAIDRRGRSAAAFAVPVALSALVVGYVQWRWFGSPLRSGYGSAGTIYAAANVAPNVRLYAGWLLETQGPLLFAAPLAVLFAPGRRLGWLMAFAAAAAAAYLIYATFEVWTYLRFLLPALPIAMIAVAAIIARLIARLPSAWRSVVWIAATIAVAAFQLRSARTHGVFDVAEQHARALLAGRYLAAAMPTRSVVVAGEQSGSVRYYTGRTILRWEALTPETLAAAAGRATSVGADVWIALDEWEEDGFRRKFGALPIGTLDWPPILESGRLMRTHAWRLRDRDGFRRTGAAHTDRVR
jgi:hypothetical protein